MGDKPATPMGRGKLLAALVAKKKEMSETRPGMAEPAEAPKAPRGRAALLTKVREQMSKLAMGAGEPSPSTKHEDAPETVKTKEVAVPQSVTESVKSNVDATPLSYKGNSGKEIHMNANYIRLSIDKGKGVFEYHLEFNPIVDAKNMRIGLLRSKMEEMGNVKTFDGGSCLYLPTKLPNDVTIFNCLHPNDQSDITMTVTYKKQKRLGDCIHLFNVLFKRVMHVLQYKRMGRNFFDPAHVNLIPQHKLEVLPGYAVAVDEYEDGLMVCLDTQHRVLRTETALELIRYHHRMNKERLTEEVTRALLGSIVLTKYNNQTYRVDDIIWDMTPSSTFETQDGSSVTFYDYYKRQHGLEITNMQQPLLLHVQKRKVSGQAEEVDRKICLVPEFCYMTGLTDQMRADFKVMKDVAQFTRITPHQRIFALRQYMNNVSQSPQAQKILADWGMRIADGVIDLQARIITPELILFGNNTSQQSDQRADWSAAQSKNPCLAAIDIKNWVIVHTERDTHLAQMFSEKMTRFAPTMGCRITPARLYACKNDRTLTYVNASNEVINDNVQVVVYIFSSARDDLYSAVKRITCVQSPVACQVVIGRNLANEKKARTIMLKLAHQINCKLGGALWALRIPCKDWMICGIDVYHSPKNKQSVLGFVASTNETFTSWFSLTAFQDGELSNTLKMCFVRALENYRNIRGRFPKIIIVYRDGVGDGQLEYCKQHEVSQFEEAIRNYQIEDCHLTFIVVQKRINTRLIYPDTPTGNPPPGTVLDHSITRRHMYDFFLVPQHVTQGTVTPTHYIVLHDPYGHKPDNIQRLSYKLCHLYYNWSGTIRVPAPCQYAHKVAGLVGQYIGKTPHEVLNNRLYYL